MQVHSFRTKHKTNSFTADLFRNSHAVSSNRKATENGYSLPSLWFTLLLHLVE